MAVVAPRELLWEFNQYQIPVDKQRELCKIILVNNDFRLGDYNFYSKIGFSKEEIYQGVIQSSKLGLNKLSMDAILQFSDAQIRANLRLIMKAQTNIFETIKQLDNPRYLDPSLYRFTLKDLIEVAANYNPCLTATYMEIFRIPDEEWKFQIANKFISMLDQTWQIIYLENFLFTQPRYIHALLNLVSWINREEILNRLGPLFNLLEILNGPKEFLVLLSFAQEHPILVSKYVRLFSLSLEERTELALRIAQGPDGAKAFEFLDNFEIEDPETLCQIALHALSGEDFPMALEKHLFRKYSLFPTNYIPSASLQAQLPFEQLLSRSTHLPREIRMCLTQFLLVFRPKECLLWLSLGKDRGAYNAVDALNTFNKAIESDPTHPGVIITLLMLTCSLKRRGKQG